MFKDLYIKLMTKSIIKSLERINFMKLKKMSNHK